MSHFFHYVSEQEVETSLAELPRQLLHQCEGVRKKKIHALEAIYHRLSHIKLL